MTNDLQAIADDIVGRPPRRPSHAAPLDASLDAVVAEVLGRTNGWPETRHELSADQSARLEDFAKQHGLTPDNALALLRARGKARVAAAERAARADAIVADIRGETFA